MGEQSPSVRLDPGLRRGDDFKRYPAESISIDAQERFRYKWQQGHIFMAFMATCAKCMMRALLSRVSKKDYVRTCLQNTEFFPDLGRT